MLWHGSLIVEHRDSLEQLQKNALRVILKDSFINYENAFEKLNLETVEARREKLSIKFALKCNRNCHAKDRFRQKTKLHQMNLRVTETYEQAS